MEAWEVYPRVATAVALQAQRDGVARLTLERAALMERSTQLIRNARDSTAAPMREGLIAAPPAK
jgi:hypothetical protein